MLNCEVMLKDMADSKRINNNIKAPAALRPNCTPSAADLEARSAHSLPCFPVLSAGSP
jgi:hypothetical protein